MRVCVPARVCVLACVLAGGGIGSFAATFKQQGKMPIEVWEKEYVPQIKKNGWGSGGRNLPKTRKDREAATRELDYILGR